MQKDSGTALSVICDIVGGPCGIFLIQLSDETRAIVSQCRCRANATAKFPINTPGLYRITVVPCPEKDFVSPMGASRWVALTPDGHSLQFFKFCHMAQCPMPLVRVQFSLTDAYYPNLPINEGALKLWHNIS